MGHIHAQSMMEYAKDAAETDKPWERWEVSFNDGFVAVTGHPHWSVNHQYRRKLKTIMLGEYEVPEPCREPLRLGQRFWAVNPFAGPREFTWECSEEDFHALKSGFVLLTEEAAEKHY